MFSRISFTSESRVSAGARPNGPLVAGPSFGLLAQSVVCYVTGHHRYRLLQQLGGAAGRRRVTPSTVVFFHEPRNGTDWPRASCLFALALWLFLLLSTARPWQKQSIISEPIGRRSHSGMPAPCISLFFSIWGNNWITRQYHIVWYNSITNIWIEPRILKLICKCNPYSA